MQVLRPTSNAISLPSDAVIEGAVVEGSTAIPVKAVFTTNIQSGGEKDLDPDWTKFLDQ